MSLIPLLLDTFTSLNDSGATSDELRTKTTMFLDWEQGCGYEQFEHDWNRLLNPAMIHGPSR